MSSRLVSEHTRPCARLYSRNSTGIYPNLFNQYPSPKLPRPPDRQSLPVALKKALIAISAPGLHKRITAYKNITIYHNQSSSCTSKKI
ncbi:hypothetical protein O988_07909 [Pseudogymnoascus sp. VKM F-3808]|nr:hypothetical protein O988_07909 [Pseudogymnoascus sp. VKM F-3808]